VKQPQPLNLAKALLTDPLKSLLAGFADLTLCLDNRGTIQFYQSQDLAEVSGLSVQNIGDRLQDILPLPAREQFMAALAATQNNPSKIRFQYTLFPVSPEQQYEVTLLRAGENQILGLIDRIGDRGEPFLQPSLQQTLAALKDSEERFRAIFEQAAIGIAKLDVEGRFLQVNQRCCDLLGYSKAELQQRNCHEITHPEDRFLNQECNIKLLQGKTQNYSLEKRYIGKNGQVHWVNLTVAAVAKGDSSCGYFIAAIEDISDRKRTEQQLYQQECSFRTLAENLPDIIARYDRNYCCVYINPALETATGIPLQTPIGKPIDWVASSTAKGLDWRNYLKQIFETKQQQVIEFQYNTPQGDRIYQAKLTPECSPEGTVDFVLIVTRDISEQQKALAALQESEQRFRRIFEQAAIGLNRADLNGRYIQVNQKFCELLGYSEAELLQLTYREITHPSDVNQNLELMKRLFAGEINHFSKEKRLICKDGQVKWVNLTVSLVCDPDGKPLYDIGIVEDISDRKQAEAQLLQNALYDPVTGLPNRNLFKDRLQVVLDRASGREHICFAVLFIDLDRFKLVNDSLGHGGGDELLVKIGQRLVQCLRQEDTIARFGGDEFAVLLSQIGNLYEATQVAERLQAQFNTPFQVQDQELTLSASIGIVSGHDPVTGEQYSNLMDLLRDADIAMYQAKRKGKACYEVFSGNLHDESRSQLQLENELRRGLRASLNRESDCRELQLYYQPIIDLKRDRLVGFEALIRWHHPRKGLMSPGRFIPAAEESHLIVELGEWVLREACQQLRRWNAQALLHPPFTLSVNLAGRQLAQTDLISQISRIIADAGVLPHYLCLEITEVAIVENITSVAQKLEKLKGLGLKLSIDDFGTGYSSLSRLQSFPLDTLKIDQSFVKDLQVSSDSREIVKTILNLASGLKLNAIAEGIETEQQRAFLQNAGCSQGQGFLFARPMTATQATHWLTGDSLSLNFS
jgi:diguanylate cyclase (GGDEF)-like protein/PAS domain S-box-containing protein